MKLAELLADKTSEDLERLARDHAKTEEHLTRPQLLTTIEGVLRSYRFLQEFLFNRQPPTFSMITLLLDAPGFAFPSPTFRDGVLADAARICDALDSGELLERDDQLRVYRRVVYQARSNDMQMDSSESAILGVLRQELAVAQVEHCLIEHHRDLREFWRQENAFDREFQALQAAGLVFERDGQVILPEDLVTVVRQVFGIDMPKDAARRLFDHLAGSDLHAGLQELGAPTSGSKSERIERLITHMAQPRVVLRGVALEDLRSICRDTGAAVSGSKDDLLNRVVAHFAAGRDLLGEPEPPPPPPAEPRYLSERRFALLFGHLRGHELAGILGEFDLRRWGTKDMQIQTLWEAERSEATLLACFSNLELDSILRRVDLKAGGSKADRIERLLQHFSSLSEEQDQAGLNGNADAPDEPGP